MPDDHQPTTSEESTCLPTSSTAIDIIGTFQVPERAFKTLISWDRPSFNYYFQANPLTDVHLVGAAALMLGTTAELTQALNAMLANQLTSFTVDLSDHLVIHHLRIQNYSVPPLTRSLICLAPLRGWWGTDDYRLAGTRLARGTTLKRQEYDQKMVWRPLYNGQLYIGIQMQDLITKVVPLAQGEKAWLHFRDP